MMPERKASSVSLQANAYISGWFLTAWAVIAALLALTDRTQIGTTLVDMGAAQWITPAVLVVVAVLHLFGHAARAIWLLVAADVLGGLAAAMSASILGWVTIHGGAAAIAALNWAFMCCMFLLHTWTLRRD